MAPSPKRPPSNSTGLRRSHPAARPGQTLRLPVLDATRRPIRKGDVVEVPAADWSRGVAKWMTEVPGEVVAVGRTRVEVRFAGHERTHRLPAFVLQVVVTAKAREATGSPIDP
jgi:hypothetical protein